MEKVFQLAKLLMKAQTVDSECSGTYHVVKAYVIKIIFLENTEKSLFKK